MLRDFLIANHALLIERCRAMVTTRSPAKSVAGELLHGIPVFLDQLIDALTVVRTSSPLLTRSLSGTSSEDDVKQMATLHGRELLLQGFTLEQVVREYGDVCQAVTNLAFETGAQIGVAEFRTFNLCLDNAIAGAVTEYARHSATSNEIETQAWNFRLGTLAHELRNHLQNVTLAVKAIKGGQVGIAGSTGAVLERSIHSMRNLIDQSLADVRLAAGVSPHFQLIDVAKFLGDIEAAASLEAQARGLHFTVTPVEGHVAVYADPEMLNSAVGNLIHNAFKFTQPSTHVRLHAYGAAGRVLIEVEDRCGGLPAGATDSLFKPFIQSGANRSGLGLGLDICRRNIEANRGTVIVEDKPGAGCVFRIDLPQYANFELA